MQTLDAYTVGCVQDCVQSCIYISTGGEVSTTWCQGHGTLASCPKVPKRRSTCCDGGQHLTFDILAWLSAGCKLHLCVFCDKPRSLSARVTSQLMIPAVPCQTAALTASPQCP